MNVGSSAGQSPAAGRARDRGMIHRPGLLRAFARQCFFRAVRALQAEQLGSRTCEPMTEKIRGYWVA